MGGDLAIRLALRRLDADDPVDERRVVAGDVLHEFELGPAGSDHQPFPRVAQRLDRVVEEAVVLGRTLAADRAGAVVDVPVGRVRTHDARLEILFAQMKDPGLAMIDPDDGVKMGHCPFFPSLAPTNDPPTDRIFRVAAGPALIFIKAPERRPRRPALERRGARALISGMDAVAIRGVAGRVRRGALFALCLAAFAVFSPPTRAAGDPAGISYFRIATGPLAGTYFPVGQAIADLISKPPGSAPCGPAGRCGVPGLVATAQASEGSIANVRAVAGGAVDSALAQADVVDWAWRGANMFQKEGPRANLRVVASLYRESVHLVARRGAGIAGVRDLAKKRVGLDVPGSGTGVDARLILSAYGLKERDVVVSSLDVGGAADALLAGQIDAFFFVGGWPAPAIADLAAREAVDLVPIEGPGARALSARQPFLSPEVIPAGTYGRHPDVPTLGVGALWIVSAEMDEERVYQLTRALFDPVNRPLLERGHPKAAAIRLGTALDGISVPVHPGAMRYYRLMKVETP